MGTWGKREGRRRDAEAILRTAARSFLSSACSDQASWRKLQKKAERVLVTRLQQVRERIHALSVGRADDEAEAEIERLRARQAAIEAGGVHAILSQIQRDVSGD